MCKTWANIGNCDSEYILSQCPEECAAWAERQEAQKHKNEAVRADTYTGFNTVLKEPVWEQVSTCDDIIRGKMGSESFGLLSKMVEQLVDAKLTHIVQEV